MLPVDSVVHQPPQCRALALGVVVSCGVAAAASVGAHARASAWACDHFRVARSGRGLDVSGETRILCQRTANEKSVHINYT